jgi:2-polyprenyl-3-methyl-5-hydroxy-6-metoxy-1,4-benzoquinol methylase
MFFKIGELKPPDYHGIRVMAAYGLHSDIFKLLSPFLKKGIHILDMGCGEGAFSQRLIDAGMVVDGCDLDAGQIRADVNRKIAIDLNKDINADSFPEKYDILIAVEILEHLENPWKFISDCLSLINDDGIIILSTPNISNFVSRLRFFMRGSLIAFENSDIVHGHITPLSFIQIENICRHFRLKILKKGYAGTVPIIHITGFSLFSFFRNVVLPFFYPFMSGPKNGRALVYILSKNG